MRNSLRMAATLTLLAGSVLAAACSDDDGPIRIGLVAGISGGNADLGQAGRNGAMLAVEEVNRAGGIDGRRIELLIRDDGNNQEMAIAAAKDFVKDNVTAIVGPFTTAMADAVRGVTEPAQMLVFSPTASATQFSGLDDHFFRICGTARDNAEDYAELMAVRRGYRRVALALDATNSTFAGNFLDAFRRKYSALGGDITVEAWHDFRSVVGFVDLVKQLLGPKPDAVFFVANAVDVARLSQQFRNLDASTPIVAVEWAGTQQLIELGGKAVDGVEVLQLFDRFGKEEQFLRFAEEYRRRFEAPPSFSSILAYEVVTVLATALEGRRGGQGIKEAILANGPYQGLQQQLTIDRFGDSRRASHFVAVRGTEFVPAP